MSELRRLEADLKRKSDLLSEVKILLAQAAERERSLISERDDAKSKVLQTITLHINDFLNKLLHLSYDALFFNSICSISYRFGSF